MTTQTKLSSKALEKIAHEYGGGVSIKDLPQAGDIFVDKTNHFLEGKGTKFQFTDYNWSENYNDLEGIDLKNLKTGQESMFDTFELRVLMKMEKLK